MNWLLDIFLVLIFLLIMVISTEKGFVKSIWSTVTLVGAFVLAYMFGTLLGEWICDNFVLDHVSKYAFGIVEKLAASSSAQYDISYLFEALPDEFVTLVENCGADLEALESQFSLSVTVSQDELYSFAESVALPISRTLSKAVGIVVVFLAAVLALWLVGLVVKVIAKIPIIKTIDGFLGFLVGLIKGFIVVWIICVAVGIFVERGFMEPDSMEALKLLTDGSYIFKFFCNLSPVNFINIQ